MTKVGLVGVALSLLLSLVVLAGEKSTSKQAKAPGGQAEAAQDQGKGRPQGRGERMDPASQLAALKKEHQAALAELLAIKQLAVKEKATQTAAALDKLMARQEQEHQKKIEPLQLRLKKLESALKEQGQEQQKAAEQAQKGATKQSQKGDGAKTKK